MCRFALSFFCKSREILTRRTHRQSQLLNNTVQGNKGYFPTKFSHHSICLAAQLQLCPEPDPIAHGDVSFTAQTVGSIATYTCNSGFKLIGSPIATCTSVDMGPPEFQPEPPTCQRK